MRLVLVMVTMAVMTSSFRMMLFHLIFSLILIRLRFSARTALLILLSVPFGFLQCLGDDAMMLFQFRSNILGFLLGLGVALNFLLKLFLDLMKLILPLFCLNFSDGFFVESMFPYLFGDLILNLLTLFVLFLLIWGQGLRFRRVEWLRCDVLRHTLIDLFLNCFLYSLLDMILELSRIGNISEWFHSLVDDVRIKTRLLRFVILDDLLLSPESFIVSHILGLWLWLGYLVLNRSLYRFWLHLLPWLADLWNFLRLRVSYLVVNLSELVQRGRLFMIIKMIIIILMAFMTIMMLRMIMFLIACNS